MSTTDRGRRPPGSTAVRAWLEHARDGAWPPLTDGDVAAPLEQLEAALELLEAAEQELLVQREELATLTSALETERSHYLELFEAAPDSYLVTDAHGVIMQANRAAHVLTGFQPGTLKGQPLDELIDTQHRSELRAQIGRLNRLERLTHWDVDLHLRNGVPVPISISAAAIESTGHAPFVLRWLLRDVRDRKVAEETRRRLMEEQAARVAWERTASQARFLAEAGRSFLQVLGSAKTARRIASMAVPRMADLCVLYGRESEGVFRCTAVAHHDDDCDRRARTLLGQALDFEAIDGPARVARTGEPEIVAQVDDAYLAGCAPRRESRELLASLTPRTAVAVAFHDQGETAGVLWLVNTTDRPFDPDLLPLAESYAERACVALRTAAIYDELIRARDLAATANEEKARFLTTLSHDFRTPLAAVMGYTDLLLSGVVQDLPERACEWIGRIRAGTEHQLALVDQLLSYTRVENREQQPSFEDIDLRRSVETAVELVRVQAHREGLVLGLDIPDTPFTIRTDPGLLGQVLANLLANAIRFTHEGGVRVGLSQEGTEAVIRVQDTGVGIPAHALGRVFDQFWQAEPKEDSVNRGLGLTIARRNTELLGGRIEVSSVVGQGTTFAVRLPVSL